MVKNGMCFHHDVLYNINLQKSHFKIFLLTSAQISRGISSRAQRTFSQWEENGPLLGRPLSRGGGCNRIPHHDDISGGTHVTVNVIAKIHIVMKMKWIECQYIGKTPRPLIRTDGFIFWASRSPWERKPRKSKKFSRTDASVSVTS